MKKFFVALLSCMFFGCMLFLFACNNNNNYLLPTVESEYSVTISSSIENAVEFDGEVEQVVSKESEFTPVKATAKLGYEIVNYTVNGVIYDFETIDLDNINQDTKIVVNVDYATYELPIINIFAQDEITSKEDYVDMNFSLTNCYDELVDVTGGIRLRGNSTMGYPKKPYRIKFDSKQSLFGLEKAKSWVLLAEYLDPSSLHNYTAMTLGNEADGLSFTTTPNKVNVYLNNEFLGLYTLCEQVQENKGRMDIEFDITDEMTTIFDYNFFLSMDESCIADAGATLDETYIYNEKYDKYFEIKYPEKDDFPTETQFNTFVNQLKVYVDNVLGIISEGDFERICGTINVDSLMDYYLVDLIMQEHDHYSKSFNMYYTTTSSNPMENYKLNFGPIWDYDWCLDTPFTGEPNETFTADVQKIYYSNCFFDALKLAEFKPLLATRYSKFFKAKLTHLPAHLETLKLKMRESLDLNAKKWYSNYDYDITSKNIEFLVEYLVERKLFLDEYFSI